MKLIVILAIFSALAVLPLKLVAKLMGANNTGIFACLLALFVSAIVQNVTGNYISNELLAGIATVALSGVVYSFILDAKYFQGVLIAILTYVLQIVILGLILGIGAMSSAA